MIKKILSLIFLLTILCACTKVQDRIYLSDEYYNLGEFIDIKSDKLEELNDGNYVIYVYNNYCNLKIPCDTIFKKFMENNKIDFLSMQIEEYKKTKLYETVKYAPSVIVVEKEKVIAYLDANSDTDLKKYQDVNEFTNWISKYIYLKNLK